MHRHFRNVKYLNIGLTGISLVDTVWIEESVYGECLVYSELKPAFVLALISNLSGNFIEEFDYYRKKHNLNTYKFLDKILSLKTEYSIKPRIKNSISFFIKDMNRGTVYDISYMDFDPIWYGLSKQDLKRIIS